MYKAVIAFTPGAAIAGGLILGVASLAHYVQCGKAVGASGLMRAFTHKKVSIEERVGHLPFFGGLVTAAFWAMKLTLIPVGGYAFAQEQWRRVAAGVLIGVGSVAGNGCTSGHGLSGIGRLSLRSLVNTMVFMVSGAVTAIVTDTTGAFGISQRTKTLDRVKWLTVDEFNLFSMIIGTGAIVAATIAYASRKNLLPRTGKVADAIRVLHEYASGAFFGLGLCVGGMVNPMKVAAFLAFTKNSFDPSLMVLMASALAVLVPGYYFVKTKIERPTFHHMFAEPFKGITTKMLIGGTLFGAGWGLAGVCPGPLYVNFGAHIMNGSVFESGAIDMLLAFFVGQNLMREFETLTSTGASCEKKPPSSSASK